MPDSQPTPPWGLAYDERDLDALLSGDGPGTPAALRPVEGTLAALQASGTPRELSNEAAARAAYRAFWPGSQPFGSHPSFPLPAAASGPHPGVSAHTLILPAADGRSRPPSRHRHRRPRPASSGRRRPGLVLTGAGAAALVVVAVVTGALTGSIGKLTSFGHQPAGVSASALATGRGPGSQGEMATGAARDRVSAQRPSPKPKPTVSAPPAPHPTPDPGTLCREYFGYLLHPTPAGRTAWVTERGQLAKLAGDQSQIAQYCLHNLVSPLGAKGGWPSIGTSAGAPGAPGATSSAGSNGSAGSAGSAGDNGTAGEGAGDNPNTTASAPAGQSNAGISTQQGQSGDAGPADSRP
jgi:hypothetical protein